MEIKISKCGTRCKGCEEEFSHEQAVQSSVTISEDSFERRDYCMECYRGLAEQDPAYCSWTIQYTDPRVLEAERHEALSPLRRVFYDAASSDMRTELAQAYLAAQLLKRQRVFRQVKESEQGDTAARTTLFLDRAGNRLIEARDLNFSYTELDEARLQLMERLRSLETPETPETPEPSEQVNDHVKTATP